MPVVTASNDPKMQKTNVLADQDMHYINQADTGQTVLVIVIVQAKGRVTICGRYKLEYRVMLPLAGLIIGCRQSAKYFQGNNGSGRQIEMPEIFHVNKLLK